jgi:ABC-type lipoprotein release transport system permease subunit
VLTLKIALRNLLRQKRRSILTGSSMLVGFVLACFFIGWADGTYNHIIDTFTRNRLGHIQIHREGYLDKAKLYKTIDDPEAVFSLLRDIEPVDSWAPRVFAAGLVSISGTSVGAEVIGVDPEAEDRTTGFSEKLVAGRCFAGTATDAGGGGSQGASSAARSSGLAEAILGKDLARILEGGVGDTVVIVSQAADGSIANDLYQVIGLVDTGDPGLNRSAFYLPLAEAQQLFVLRGRVHEIAVTVDSLNHVASVTQTLADRLSGTGLEVSPWQVFARDFYRAMQADKNGMYLSLAVVIIVVAITVLNTILMSVLERQKEYGVLRAVGTRPGQIVAMVISETGLLTLAAVILGSVLGFLLNFYFSRHGLVLANPITWGSVQLEVMKGEINARSFYLPALTVAVTSLVVCLFPALHAARTEPAETMRMF